MNFSLFLRIFIVLKIISKRELCKELAADPSKDGTFSEYKIRQYKNIIREDIRNYSNIIKNNMNDLDFTFSFR